MAGQVLAWTRSVLFSGLAAAVLALGLAGPASGASLERGDDDSPGAVLAVLQEKYGAREKKYAALAQKVAKEVARALDQTEWRAASGNTPARTYRQHPWVVLVDRLAEAARAKPDLRAETRALLAKYPWRNQLELVEGLQYGSDRPVPEHENGFIELGEAPDHGCDPLPTFVNSYLFGLQEIVGWGYGVERSKKSLQHRARKPKEAATLESKLPPWEALRVYLTGSLPEVPLLAIPRLQHEIHSRLAQRRVAKGSPAVMDDLLAFLDSRWNGFTVQVPYAEESLAIALPVFALMADRSQLVYCSPIGDRLSQSGDIPFVSILTLQAYAKSFRGETLEPRDFIARSEGGGRAADAFQADCNYLIRYRGLIDLFVYTLLAPDLSFPGYEQYLDYPGGTIPRSRDNDRALDVPRAHALLVWAAVQKDPARLADWLQDELLGQEPNRFPMDVSLPVALTLLVRERERALLEELSTTLAARRESTGGADDLELEFAPWKDASTPSSDLATPFLVHSFHEQNAAVAELIRETALAVVRKEL